MLFSLPPSRPTLFQSAHHQLVALPVEIVQRSGESVRAHVRHDREQRNGTSLVLIVFNGFLLRLVRPGAPSSFLLLVVRHLFLVASCYY